VGLPSLNPFQDDFGVSSHSSMRLPMATKVAPSRPKSRPAEMAHHGPEICKCFCFSYLPKLGRKKKAAERRLLAPPRGVEIRFRKLLLKHNLRKGLEPKVAPKVAPAAQHVPAPRLKKGILLPSLSKRQSSRDNTPREDVNLAVIGNPC
jgi:hypothetical protein